MSPFRLFQKSFCFFTFVAWALHCSVADARLLNLSEIDFQTHPELLPIVGRLESTLQMFETPEHGNDFHSNQETSVLAPQSEGGSRLRAICSASFIDSDRVVTAGHCLHTKRVNFSKVRMLRRFHFKVVDGRLHRVGYKDYALTGEIVGTAGDLVILRIATNGNPPRFSFPTEADYQVGQRFVALGFPNESYGIPYASVDCTIVPGRDVVLTFFEGHDFAAARCPLVGGMSGGPQFILATAAQLGVSSTSNPQGQSVSGKLKFLNP